MLTFLHLRCNKFERGTINLFTSFASRILDSKLILVKFTCRLDVAQHTQHIAYIVTIFMTPCLVCLGNYNEYSFHDTLKIGKDSPINRNQFLSSIRRYVKNKCKLSFFRLFPSFFFLASINNELMRSDRDSRS